MNGDTVDEHEAKKKMTAGDGIFVHLGLGLGIGLVSGLAVWYAGFRGLAVVPKPRMLIAVVIFAVIVGLMTWLKKYAGGFGATLGIGIGIMPGTLTVLSAGDKVQMGVQTIMIVGAVIIGGLVVAVIVQALRLAVTGAPLEETGANLDLPESVRHRRRGHDD